MMVSVTHMHTYGSAIAIPMSPPSWTCLLPPTLPHPSRSSQSAGLHSQHHTASPTGCLFYMWQCICSLLYTVSIHPTLSPRLCAQVCSLCAAIFSCTLRCFPVCTGVKSHPSHIPARSRRSCPGSVRAGIVFA